MTLEPIVIGERWTVPKVYEKKLEKLELRRKIETIELWRSVRIHRKILNIRGDLLSLWLKWNPPGNAGV